MEINDFDLYKQNYHFGYLVGRLEAMARLNDNVPELDLVIEY
ncbi:MAG TPA: hypothetical protein VFJ43_13040 [Bacteroidia bacterium]|nr:hypothetical protein [Bacteroidia bacterium]